MNQLNNDNVFVSSRPWFCPGGLLSSYKQLGKLLAQNSLNHYLLKTLPPIFHPHCMIGRFAFPPLSTAFKRFIPP